MATRFVQEAEAQLAPIYQQQENAISAKIPSIQKLYDNLVGGLEQQRGTETQKILESASQRGVLRSTLPVDLQQDLGREILQQRGQFDLQRSNQIGDIYSQLSGLKLQRASGIQTLADSLQAADLREREFQRQLEADRAARAAAASAASSQNAWLQLLQNKLNGTPQSQPTNRTPLDSIFGTNSGIKVVSPSQSNLLQPAGRVLLQQTSNPQRAAAPTTRTTQPRLQGAGATGGILRIR